MIRNISRKNPRRQTSPHIHPLIRNEHAINLTHHHPLGRYQVNLQPKGLINIFQIQRGQELITKIPLLYTPYFLSTTHHIEITHNASHSIPQFLSTVCFLKKKNCYKGKQKHILLNDKKNILLNS